VVALDENFRLDLLWWRDNIVGWNGISFLEFSEFQNKVALDASSDSALGGGPGLGGFNFITNHWFKCSPPPQYHDWHISDLELLAHIVCFQLWSQQWYGYQIYGLTDSEPCKLLLWHSRSRKIRCLAMARTLAALEHRLSFLWISGSIHSVDNILPDCASRWGDPEHRATFWRTCGELGIVPVEDSVTSDMFLF
jgi:hypothetical protein